jgi:hypothetical protein
MPEKPGAKNSTKLDRCSIGMLQRMCAGVQRHISENCAVLDRASAPPLAYTKLLHECLLRRGGIANPFDIRKCDYHSRFSGTDNVLQCLLGIDSISESRQEGGPSFRVG